MLAFALPFFALSLIAPQPVPHAGLEALKGMAGSWHQVDEEGKTTDQLISVFKITAGGSAVQETLFPDTPNEMVTFYYLEGDDLMLTHYCMVGNRPQMKALRDTRPDQLHFHCVGGPGVGDENSAHMHHADLRFLGKDRYRAEWQLFENGEYQHGATFEMARVTPQSGR